MKRHTEQVTRELALRLQDAGMRLPEKTDYRNYVVTVLKPTYAEIFDWLMEKGIEAEVYLSMTRQGAAPNSIVKIYAWIIHTSEQINYACGEDDNMSWMDAANAVIEEALDIMKEKQINGKDRSHRC